MKKFITIMTICFLSFLNLTSINAQNTPWTTTNIIGISPFSSFTPATYLDVNGGDIRIYSPSNGYRLGTMSYLQPNYVLWYNGDTSCIFCGEGAGYNSTYWNAPLYNTFLGNNAGRKITTGGDNTFLGWSAGNINTTGAQNTFIGSNAGILNNADENTFLGMQCGQFNTSGERNTFLGEESGQNNTTGSFNLLVGHQAGYINTTGRNNTFIGTQADAIAGKTGLINATAIGYRAKVAADNTVIIGTDSVNVGIGLSRSTWGPQNSLEINSSRISFNWQGAGGTNSGLRFRQLTSLNTPIANTGNLGVLALDTAGNVIYVPDGGGGLGNICASAIPNYLTNDWEIPLNNHNFIFSDRQGGDGYLNDRVGIGKMAVACTPSAKLDVQNDASPGGINFGGIFNTYGSNNTPATSYYGVEGVSQVKNSPWNNIGGAFVAWNSAINNIGVTGDAGGNIGKNNMGGCFRASNVNLNEAVHGDATSTIGSWSVGGNFMSNGINTGSNYGVSANVSGGAVNFGVFSVVNTPTATFPWPVDIAVYGAVDSLVNPAFAGYFDGNVNINGWAICTASAWVSDAMFKTNVDSITNAMNLIMRLKSKSYDFINNNNTGMKFPKQRQMGFIAEDVEQVLPSLVIPEHKPAMVDSLGNIVKPSIDYKALDYIEFIPLLTRGIQEQSRTIDSMRNQLNDLRTIINECCAANHTRTPINNNGSGKSNTTSSINVNLKDGQSIVLEQNVPNPFAEQTTINYYLPENTGKAQMLFYNAGGKLIQSVELTERGAGQLNVFAQDLTNGMYTYTLVVDGKIVSTKKMVKQ